MQTHFRTYKPEAEAIPYSALVVPMSLVLLLQEHVDGHCMQTMM